MYVLYYNKHLFKELEITQIFKKQNEIPLAFSWGFHLTLQVICRGRTCLKISIEFYLEKVNLLAENSYSKT